jgi:hypothetical protein
MLEALFWVTVGLVVGWNVLPQPKWVKTLWNKWFDKINF